MVKTHFWLRAETKANEKRVALTPNAVTALCAKGCAVTVEKCELRIFNLEEYAAIEGVHIVEKGSWRTAPTDAYILGLKELPENDSSFLTHKVAFNN
jgi:saccharopine dehydrogenase (NAD+, L-lysine-forming)